LLIPTAADNIIYNKTQVIAYNFNDEVADRLKIYHPMSTMLMFGN